MPEERLRSNRAVEEDEGMKITVVGAVLIIAAVVAVALVIRALASNKGRGPEQGQGQA